MKPIVLALLLASGFVQSGLAMEPIDEAPNQSVGANQEDEAGSKKLVRSNSCLQMRPVPHWLRHNSELDAKHEADFEADFFEQLDRVASLRDAGVAIDVNNDNNAPTAPVKTNSPQLEEKFWIACESKNTRSSEFVKFMQAGMSPNSKKGQAPWFFADNRESALICAVKAEAYEVCKTLLEGGADANEGPLLYPDKSLVNRSEGNSWFPWNRYQVKWPALCVAASSGSIPLCKLLLPYTNEEHYVAALGAAAANGHRGIAKLLLSAIPCTKQCTEIFSQAVERDWKEIALELAQKGVASYDLIHNEFGTRTTLPVLLVIFERVDYLDWLDVCDALLKHNDVNKMKKKVEVYTTSTTQSTDAKGVITRTTSSRYELRESLPALYIAVQRGSDKTCKLLLDHGADASDTVFMGMGLLTVFDSANNDTIKETLVCNSLIVKPSGLEYDASDSAWSYWWGTNRPHKQLLHLLWCLKLKDVPKDVRYKIICSNDELQMKLSAVLAPRVLGDRLIPWQFIPCISRHLACHTINQLISKIRQLIGNGTDEKLRMIDRYGKKLQENIEQKLYAHNEKLKQLLFQAQASAQEAGSAAPINNNNNQPEAGNSSNCSVQ